MIFEDVMQKSGLCLDVGSNATCSFGPLEIWLLLGAAGFGVFFFATASRLTRNLRTLPALAWMPVLSRRLANWVKSRDYTEAEFLRADGAGEAWVERRKHALD